MEVRKNKKKKGYLTVIAILVFSFISWAIFSASFLISEELFVLKDKKELGKFENQENILESVFLFKIDEIEKEISENTETKDIIEYFMKKDEKLLWLNNYDNFTKSDNGYSIDKLVIKNAKEEKVYDYIENKNIVFKYLNLIKNNSDAGKRNTADIYFSKDIKNVYAEKVSEEKYNININGIVRIEYIIKNNKLDEEDLITCEIKRLQFEIY